MSEKYSEQFEQLFNSTRKIAKICGLDGVDPNYERNWRTGVIFFLLNFGCGVTIYTIYDDIANGSWGNVLISMSILCIGIKGYTKFAIQIRDIAIVDLRYMHRETSDLYIKYENKSSLYTDELKASISRVKKLLSSLFLLVSSTVALLCGVPLFTLLVFGERAFILPFFIPYVDVDTNFGYYLTTAAHAICVFFAAFGNFISDSWCFIYVAHVPLMSNLLKCKLRDLDITLNAHPKDIYKSKPILLDLLKWHQKYNNFSQKIKDYYFWIIFVEITAACVSIVCTILCIFLKLWPVAPGFLIYSFAHFYCFCALGNIVEVANEDVILYIYDSCWYHLTAPEQKMVLYMLRNAQQATGITIGDIAPLSLSTALQMTKNFYTLSMLLQEFLNN